MLMLESLWAGRETGEKKMGVRGRMEPHTHTAHTHRAKQTSFRAPNRGSERQKIEWIPVVPLLEPANYRTINQNCNFQLKDDSTLRSDG